MIGTELNHTGCKPPIAIKPHTKFARHILIISLLVTSLHTACAVERRVELH